MRNNIKQQGQVLIIFLTTLFVGGSSVALGVIATGKTLKEFEKGVETHVQDEARQQQVLELLEQWEDEGKALKKEYKKQRESLLDLFKNHSAATAEFDSVINELVTMDQQTTERMLDILYELRQQMTAEEWAKVLPGN